MTKKTIPDSVSASLNYNLATGPSTHVDHSDDYESRADFVRDAIWEKMEREYQTSDVLDAIIEQQESVVDDARSEAERSAERYQEAVERLEALTEDRDEAVEKEADEFFDQLDEVDIEK